MNQEVDLLRIVNIDSRPSLKSCDRPIGAGCRIAICDHVGRFSIVDLVDPERQGVVGGSARRVREYEGARVSRVDRAWSRRLGQSDVAPAHIRRLDSIASCA